MPLNVSAIRQRKIIVGNSEKELSVLIYEVSSPNSDFRSKTFLKWVIHFCDEPIFFELDRKMLMLMCSRRFRRITFVTFFGVFAVPPYVNLRLIRKILNAFIRFDLSIVVSVIVLTICRVRIRSIRDKNGKKTNIKILVVGPKSKLRNLIHKLAPKNYIQPVLNITKAKLKKLKLSKKSK
jgi:FlaA1/EpsC-like NDP-sugar epimerase